MTGASVDGVLFDIDDTLVDTRAAFAAAIGQVLRTYVPGADEATVGRALAAWRADAGGHYRAYTRGETTYRAQRMTRANELHAAFGGPVLDDAAYDVWDEVFESGFVGAWAAHPDAHDALRRVLDAGLLVGSLTNAATDYQTSKLVRAGLDAHLEVLVGVDTLGIGKPDPRVFVEACRRLGTEPARTAYVGDELDVDALGALRAGLIGIWVDRPGSRRVDVPPQDVAAARAAGVRVIASLSELPTALGA
ncbi:HAD family hydrolase [Cellulomonas oligotrophica]|uniref:Hydrolase n=1 Tax=Cellulomonas oligotrophica TaxID=931536 RepID=A0A7Y9FI43_9CELL|nr:HAD family hydrolase [Cellulomonas oligotrophica]NYD87728.1 putative hydrolase of the HAD superfamily [Cellulomonas oligotrophica]GIG33067.1 hydrolase [Cellulomonas oligotrophica]